MPCETTEQRRTNKGEQLRGERNRLLKMWLYVYWQCCITSTKILWLACTLYSRMSELQTRALFITLNISLIWHSYMYMTPWNEIAWLDKCCNPSWKQHGSGVWDAIHCMLGKRINLQHELHSDHDWFAMATQQKTMRLLGVYLECLQDNAICH